MFVNLIKKGEHNENKAATKIIWSHVQKFQHYPKQVRNSIHLLPYLGVLGVPPPNFARTSSNTESIIWDVRPLMARIDVSRPPARAWSTTFAWWILFFVKLSDRLLGDRIDPFGPTESPFSDKASVSSSGRCSDDFSSDSSDICVRTYESCSYSLIKNDSLSTFTQLLGVCRNRLKTFPL